MNYETVNGIIVDDVTKLAESIYKITDNNVRDSKRKERSEYEKQFLDRQQNIYKNENITNNSNKLIPKLRRILSKKFELALNDYIIIIDKFKLNSENLSRDTIEKLIMYLKNQEIYNKSKFLVNTNSKENEIQASKVAALDKDEFDKNFKEMEQERENYLKKFILKNDDNSLNYSDNIKLKVSEHLNNDNEYEKKTFDEQLSNEFNIDEIPLLEKKNIEKDIKNQILNIQHQQGKNNLLSTNIETIDEVLMFNILKDEINGSFCIKINYNNNKIIKNINKIEFLGCYINKSFCEKNNINKNPSLIIRVEEFDNNFFINEGNTSGFCQCLLEKNNTYYTYNHNDKFFGIYKPTLPISLTNLNIQLINMEGNIITKFNYTENDIINIMFKITRQL